MSVDNFVLDIRMLIHVLIVSVRKHTLILDTRKMRIRGISLCLIVLNFMQGVACLVEIELSVLQFDNPLGTSYTGQSVETDRKCCDTGGSDCRTVKDKCDVYFTFCIGSLSNDPNNAGCNGTSIDMEKDVSTDVLKITDNKKLKSHVNVTTWIKGRTKLIVNVLDIDVLPTNDSVPHVFPDLIDAFNQVVDFDPAPNYWKAKDTVVSLVRHVSLDLRIRAWCARGWYGSSCDIQCQADYYHTCSSDGHILPHRECIDPDMSVLTLRQSVSSLQNIAELRRSLVSMLAYDVCLKSTDNVSVNIKEIREKRGGQIDIVFNGYCDNRIISGLKFREVVYVMNSVKTRLVPLQNLFGSPVITPKIKFIPNDKAQVIVLIRMISYKNLVSKNCSSSGTTSPCSPNFRINFSTSSVYAPSHAINSNSLSDCNGDLVDLEKIQTPANTFNSTSLFLLKGVWTNTTLQVEVGDIKNQNFKVMHQFSMADVIIGTNFYDSHPKRFAKSTRQNTELTIEAMAWCGNCQQGDRCQTFVNKGCDRSVTTIQPDCRTDDACKHDGHCRRKTCSCTSGWTGPVCNTDIDECALGVCVHSTTCTNTPGGYSCNCDKGFTGKNCNIDIDECNKQPCRAGLACLNSYGSYHCIGVCTNNEVNENCTGNVDFCGDKPCLNNGTCSSLAFNFSCDCDTGWSGVQCDSNINECLNNTLCHNGANCTDTPGSFQCACPENFTGTFCEIDVDKCLDPTVCKNNGTCTNTEGGFSCNCTDGFMGETCTDDVDECKSFSICINGICDNTVGGYTCTCFSGWDGVRCDVDVDECLDSSSCKNNGTCVNDDGGYTCQCSKGFTGSLCDSDINECTTNPCLNGMCNNSFGSYSCTCYTGWIGVNCSDDFDECLLQNPCTNGGLCVNNPGSYSCNCTEHWTGDHCRTDVNECVETYACNFNGNCTNLNGSFSCACLQGWTGVTCKDDIDECLSSVCKNNGLCNNTDGGYICNCPSNWNGKNCDVDVNECNVFAPCRHGGTCVNTKGSYTCSCPRNWTGKNCTDDFDECLLSNACLNGGSCININGSYSCNCPPQWTGSKCENGVNECLQTPCANNGSCTDTPNGFSCTCTAEWTGKTCKENVNECSRDGGPCKHGVCKDTVGSYACDCISGYHGKNCSEDVDECGEVDFCMNDGTCINFIGSYMCHCPKAWTGINCTDDFNECENQTPCHNDGLCVNIYGGFRCQCNEGWTGDVCEKDIDECPSFPCKNGGTCFNEDGSFSCSCVDGWTGNSCDINKNECETVTCENNAKCQDLVNDFKCLCTSGYTGKTCEVTINECDSNPCHNGGKCYDHIGYFECVCPAGWDGILCETDVDECKTRPCRSGEACHNTEGNFTCTPEHFAPVTAPVTSARTTSPNSVDVFSLQFTGPVSEAQRPQVKQGITAILKLLTCHDSTNVYVSLVQNSVNTPNTVEFHAQCDRHHLTNSEVNSAIRTLSREKLASYFPVELANTHENQSWIASHITIVGGAAGGVVVLVIIVVVIVCYRRKKNSNPRERFNDEIVSELEDMDGTGTIQIRNPVYDSLYPHQTQI